VKIKQGDTYPPARFDLNADISGASSVLFRMMHLDGTAFLSEDATVEDAANGIGRYDWQAGNTDTPGAYRCEVVVTFAGGAIQRFPQRSYLEVIVSPQVPAA
jgi:hypothetical protein